MLTTLLKKLDLIGKDGANLLNRKMEKLLNKAVKMLLVAFNGLEKIKADILCS